MAVMHIEEPRRPGQAPPASFALFALGFRPFYLLAAFSAAVLLPLWLAVLSGHVRLTPTLPPMLWHGHEMLFGFAAAVIVGFLFTAVRNWTGLATPTGARLAALALLWLSARVALLTGPRGLAAVLDLAFLPVAAYMIGVLLIKARNTRNYFVLALLSALALANLIVHAGAAGWFAVDPMLGLRAAVALISVLCTVIAGRIVPSFTGNALGIKTWRNDVLDRCAIAATGVALGAWAVKAPMLLLGVSATLAAVLQMVRCYGWRPLATLQRPLLWILHVSHAWLIVALIVMVAVSSGWVADTAVTHLLTIGLISGLIVGMITRTALGHTGRPLSAGKLEAAAYVLMQIAVLGRVLPPLFVPPLYEFGLWLAGAAWVTAFLLYLVRYSPMLFAPRVDGRPG